MHKVIAKSLLSNENRMNPYRGCTHGCIYCDSRSRCYQMNHTFEDVEVKINAPDLLEYALSRRRMPCMISTGAMSDPYMPLERRYQLTHQCLEHIERHGFGVCIQTKSTDVLRDLPLLEQINQKGKTVVEMTLTTWDPKLCRIIEPNVSTTQQRVEALKVLKQAAIPTVVWLSPLLPFINDSETNLLPILDACREVSAQAVLCFGMGMTLREGNREYYYRNLDSYFPGLKHQYIKVYGSRYEVTSPNQDKLMRLFTDYCQRYNIEYRINAIFKYLRDFPTKYTQTSLLDTS